MNTHFVMGLFALGVVFITLFSAFYQSEAERLLVIKRDWGRSCGVAVYFTTNIVLPLVCGIVFLTQGIVSGQDPTMGPPGQIASTDQHDPVLQLSLTAYSRNPRSSIVVATTLPVDDSGILLALSESGEHWLVTMP